LQTRFCGRHSASRSISVQTVRPCFLHLGKLTFIFCRTLSMDRLRQLLHLSPEFLQVQYSPKMNRDATEQQCLAFVKPTNFEELMSSNGRRNTMAQLRSRIMSILKSSHDSFLQNKGLDSRLFQKSWHPVFLRQPPTLPMVDLPQMPKVSKQSLLSQVQKKHVWFVGVHLICSLCLRRRSRSLLLFKPNHQIRKALMNL
jgi:hypothetical protein